MSSMTRTRVKICGLRRKQDLHAAVAAGADAIGLVFCQRSPRHLEPEEAAVLIREVPAFVSVTALFLDPEVALVDRVLSRVGPEILQFHGRESPEFCAAFGRRYIKAVAMGGAGEDLAAAVQAHSAACGFLLDSHAPGAMGGSGSVFDWGRVGHAGASLILAGGLNADNVGAAIAAVRPWAVDVSSGVEDAPGCKSAVKMQDFLAAVRAADAQHGTFDEHSNA